VKDRQDRKTEKPGTVPGLSLVCPLTFVFNSFGTGPNRGQTSVKLSIGPIGIKGFLRYGVEEGFDLWIKFW